MKGCKAIINLKVVDGLRVCVQEYFETTVSEEEKEEEEDEEGENRREGKRRDGEHLRVESSQNSSCDCSHSSVVKESDIAPSFHQ